MQLPALAESAPEQTLWICQYELIDVQNHAIKRKKTAFKEAVYVIPLIKIYIQLKGTLMDVLASHSSLQQKQIFCVLLFFA